MGTTLRRALLAVLVGLCVPSCDNVSGGKGVQPQLLTRASREAVLMIPNWQLDAAAVAAICGPGLVACTRRLERNGMTVATITAVEPRDFNDFNALETLGHEAWHGFGATHQ